RADISRVSQLAFFLRDSLHDRARRFPYLYRPDPRRDGVQLPEGLCRRELTLLAACAGPRAGHPGDASADRYRRHDRARVRQIEEALTWLSFRRSISNGTSARRGPSTDRKSVV